MEVLDADDSLDNGDFDDEDSSYTTEEEIDIPYKAKGSMTPEKKSGAPTQNSPQATGRCSYGSCCTAGCFRIESDTFPFSFTQYQNVTLKV